MTHPRLTCAFALSFLSALAAAQTVPVTVESTGMVGIADSQTAQLNLFNPGIQPPALGVVCTAAVAFVNANGTVLKSGTLTVPPGQSMSFILRSDTDLSLLPGERREIRATITTPSVVPVATSTSTATTAASSTSLCKLVPTLEMLDTVSGRTLVVLGHVVAVPAAPVSTAPYSGTIASGPQS